jgi:hypothetical protein
MMVPIKIMVQQLAYEVLWYSENRNFIVVFEVLTAVVMKSTIFWDIKPCSPLRANRRLGETSPPSSWSKHKLSKKPAFTLISCLAYFWTLKTEAICSSETSVDSQQTTWCYIPEDGTLQEFYFYTLLISQDILRDWTRALVIITKLITNFR